MICFSHQFLTLIGIDSAGLVDGHGLAFSPLFSFGGGGNGGRDTRALEVEPEPRVLHLVGMMDRYDVGTKRSAGLVTMCVGDDRVRVPNAEEALALADLLESSSHPMALRIREAVLRASPVDPQATAVLIGLTAPVTPVRQYLVITRHPTLVQYLREQGIVGESARVLDTATEADVTGQHVIGNLPIRLAALCASYSECSLVLGPQDRGVTDLPIERVREIAQPLTTYRVERMPSPGWEDRLEARAGADGAL